LKVSRTMLDVDPSSCAITPRMSICLKRTTQHAEEVKLSDVSASLHEISITGLLAAEDCNGGCSTSTCNARKPLSAVSILLTGTSFSIITTSSVSSEEDIKRRQEKKITQSDGIQFSETVHVRKYIHVEEITENEKIAAWFRKSEYREIFKNNMRIIYNIGKREKELKRVIAKKNKEDKKKMNKKNQSHCLEDPCVDVLGGTETVCDDDVHMEHIIGIHRDDELGFCVRGLENETLKRRSTRNSTSLKAKLAVLGIQENVDEHMFTMEDEYNSKLAKLTNVNNKGAKKKIKRRFNSPKNQPMAHEEQEEDSESIRKTIEATKKEFVEYAEEQNNRMIRQIAKNYREISKHDAKDALERGLQDERTIRAMDWMESEAYANVHCTCASIHSSGKGMSVASLEQQDKRRPSTASTAATEECGYSLGVIANEGIQLGRMKRAKMFLSQFV